MGVGRYLIVLLLMLLSFIGVSLSLSDLASGVFMKELYLLLILVVVAGAAIITTTKNRRIGWFLFAVFFATFLVNGLYLSYAAPERRLGLYSVMLFSAVGFLFAITPDRNRQRPRQRPQVIIENIEPLEEKVIENVPKKRGRKKKSRGKAG
jgi:hypothetical protein